MSSLAAPPPPPPPPPPPGIQAGPPPPPPPPGAPLSPMPIQNLPQINVPRPRSKMKTFQWQKIPASNVVGKSNIWTIISHLENQYDMDFDAMDELFSINIDAASRQSNMDNYGLPENKKKRENTEICLLDAKRSLNVNIFLKQFKMGHEEIVQLVRDGHCEKFGAEKLRSLLKLLPSQEEIDAINGFTGDKQTLGNAEKFFICLMKLPNYRMRIEGLLIMEEFNINMEWIRPSIEAVIQAAKDIQENQSLQELIYLILISGNYLNSGNYAGNAAGFKLSSLLKLTEIRANKPGMNLMHYVAREAELKNQKLLRFPEEMKFLKDASQVSMDALTSDINSIATKVKAITEQIVFAGKDFQQQMDFFLKEANKEVAELEEDLKDIEIIREDLAKFFCEDIKNFKFEECFRIMQTFCDRLKAATEENIKRRIQEAKAEKRRSREFDSHRNSRDVAEMLDNSIHGNEDNIVDLLLADVRSGYSSKKYNVGNISVTKVTKVSLSPAGNSNSEVDMTDGGASLQKKLSDSVSNSPVVNSSSSLLSPSNTPVQRRSRQTLVPSADETLLDILTKGDDTSPEPEKPETRFERYSSLRRRRLERKGKRNALDVFQTERERAPSLIFTNTKSETSPTDVTSSGVKMRNSVNTSRDRPKSEVFSDEKESGCTLRRSQSLMDKSFLGNSSTADSLDESDALLRRIKQRLNRKSGRDTPPINEEEDVTIGRESPSPNSNSLLRSNSRWRRDIALSETNLSTLSETDINSKASLQFSNSEQKAQEKRPHQFTDDSNSKSSAQLLSNNNSISSEVSNDNINVVDSAVKNQISVSMRKKISSGMGTDIDGVLKTIEDTGRQIDVVGVTGPMRRVPDSNSTAPLPQVAVVAPVTTQEGSVSATSETNLKVKANSPKNEKVKPTRILSDSVKDMKQKNSTNSSLNRTHSGSSLIRRSISKPKTPPPPQERLCKSRAKAENENKNDKNQINKNEHNKTTKPAAKNSKSAPEKTQKNSAETKNQQSGGLQVHKNLQNEKEVQKTGEISNVKRRETNRLSVDSRRNGYFFSENENNVDVLLNASTDMLQCDLNNANSQIGQSPKIVKIAGLDDDNESPLEDVAKWKMKRTQQRRSTNDISKESSSNNLNINDFKYDAMSRFSFASCSDKDEGFETASGTLSQRTSMNSTLEAEVHNNPVLSRLAQKTKSLAENLFSEDSEIYIRPRKSPSSSRRLSETFDQKNAIDNWSEQSVSMINLNSVEDETSTDNVFSPDFSTKNNINKDNVSKSGFSSSSTKQKNALGAKTATSSGKSNNQGVPSYMLPTNSSASKPSNRRALSTNVTNTSTTYPAFSRNTSNRLSVRDQENVSNFQRNSSARASMKADSFQRGSSARTSIRGQRSPQHQPNSSSNSTQMQSRSPSNSSIPSMSSSTPNINAASSASSGTTRHRIASTLRTGALVYRPTSSGRPTTPSSRPTTPSGRPTTPSNRPTTPSSHLKAPSSPNPFTNKTKPTTNQSQNNSGFNRSQSMRTISNHAADSCRSVNSLSQSGRRSAVPFEHEPHQNTDEQLPERPHSTTPMISKNKSTKRLSFMSPTASSRARAEDLASTAFTRTQSLTSISSSSSSTPQTTNLRTQSKPSVAGSGRKSPATLGLHHPSKPEHYQSLSTVAEQIADEDREEMSSKKSPFTIRRATELKNASPKSSRSSNNSPTIIVAI